MPALQQEDPPRGGRGKRGWSLSVGRFDAALARPRVHALAMAAAIAIPSAIVAAAIAHAGENAVLYGPVFVALGALVIALPVSRWLWGAAALVGIWLVAVAAIEFVPHVYNPGPPVGQAIGLAAFDGTPYRGAQVGAVLSVAVPVAMALVATAWPWLERLRHRRSVPEPAASEPVAATPPVAETGGAGIAKSSVPMWIGVAVIAFTIVPDLRSYLNHAGAPIGYMWDRSNFASWQLLAQLGFVPMKDFFYPYGFQWLFTLRTVGPLYEWLAQVAVLSAAAWALWRLSGGRTWRVLGCLLVLVLVGLWLPDGWRYGAGFIMAVTYAALGPTRHARLGSGHAVFFGACLIALFYGPDAFLMGIVGAVLVLAGELGVRGLAGPPRRFAISAAVDAAPVVAAFAIGLLVWVAMGVAAGNIRLLRDVTAVSSADALDQREYGPAGLMVWYPAMYSIWAVAPALMAGAGALWMRLGRRSDPAIAPILLAASGVSLVLVLKHFVRFVDDEILIAPVLALAWAVIFAWRRDSLLRTAACAAALAALLTMLDKTGVSIGGYLKSAVSSPAHAVRSVLVAFDPAARDRAAAAEFNVNRFPSWPDVEITYQYLQTVHFPPVPSFAVVGDSQLTYALLKERPPYQVELYDASPIAEQQAMVRDLERRHPRYVIWRSNYDTDFIPYDVRDPLVFRWMIENYVPVRVYPGTSILRRRAAGQRLSAGYWRSQLGGSEDLGFIPSYSDAASAPSCTGGPGCVPYALIQGHASGGSQGIGLVVSGNSASYGVTFRIRPGVDQYPVRLDRLWFSPIVGPRPALRSLTPGVTARLVELRTGDNLY